MVLRRVVPAAHDKVMNPWPTTCAGEVVRRVMSPLVCFASAVGRAPHHPLESGFNFPPRLRPTVLRSPFAHAVIVTTALEDACAATEVVWLAGGDEDAEVRDHGVVLRSGAEPSWVLKKSGKRNRFAPLWAHRRGRADISLRAINKQTICIAHAHTSLPLLCSFSTLEAGFSTLEATATCTR